MAPDLISAIRAIIRWWRYGAPVVVVSGLPRSGTSMLMNMLIEGGLPAVIDQNRIADDDNPHGYFEFERVKDLAQESDKSWIRSTRGRAVKVISYLLKDLPADNYYYILFSNRNLEEIIASQNVMLRRRGEENPLTDEKSAELYRKHLLEVKRLATFSSNMEILDIDFHETLCNPQASADKINRFINGNLDIEKMKRVVDIRLYRNRHDGGNGYRENRVDP